MAKNKKLITLLMCAVVLIIGAASVTLAYFTDRESATNTFTVGDVDITLFEQQTENGEVTETTYTGFVYHLIPGSTYSKEPYVRVESGSSKCWIYVTVDNQIADLEPAAGSGKTIAEQMEAYHWTPVEGYKINGLQVYAYKWAVEKTDVKVFDGFTIDGDTATGDILKEYENKKIEITAYAIQATGFSTAAEAWASASPQFK